MENNIINTYIKFIKNRFLDFFRITLKNKYQKNQVEPFIDEYINVRYYNETNYSKERNFVARLNKDLLDVYDDNVVDNNEDILKTIFALFGYLIFLDDTNNDDKNLNIVRMLSEDKKIKIDLSNDLYDEIKRWYYSFKEAKIKFQETINSRNFQIEKKNVYRNIDYEVSLDYNIKTPNLYSEYAINKAYNSGVINEDKLFIEYILTCYEVLKEVISFEYSKRYIVEFANTLYEKEKKINRLFSILNNPLAKKQISIKINYSDYLENKKFINSKISEGYSFALVLDKNLEDINELILFSYIYVFESSEMFDIIEKNKENIDSKIIRV